MANEMNLAVIVGTITVRRFRAHSSDTMSAQPLETGEPYAVELVVRTVDHNNAPTQVTVRLSGCSAEQVVDLEIGKRVWVTGSIVNGYVLSKPQLTVAYPTSQDLTVSITQLAR